jgi:hypothetical protein
VLKFIGAEGRTTEEVAERFPHFDVMRLIRADLVDIVLSEPEVVAHSHEASSAEMLCVLTGRGAGALGLRLADAHDHSDSSVP